MPVLILFEKKYGGKLHAMRVNVPTQLVGLL